MWSSKVKYFPSLSQAPVELHDYMKWYRLTESLLICRSHLVSEGWVYLIGSYGSWTCSASMLIQHVDNSPSPCPIYFTNLFSIMRLLKIFHDRSDSSAPPHWYNFQIPLFRWKPKETNITSDSPLTLIPWSRICLMVDNIGPSNGRVSSTSIRTHDSLNGPIRQYWSPSSSTVTAALVRMTV